MTAAVVNVIRRHTPPCMGGWCGIRTSCACYATPSTRLEPAERLCKSGVDGQFFRPILAQRITVPVEA